MWKAADSYKTQAVEHGSVLKRFRRGITPG